MEDELIFPTRSRRQDTLRRALSVPALGLVVGVLSSATPGCNRGDVFITGVYPENGASAIPYELDGSITFSESYEGDPALLSARLSRQTEEGSTETPLALSLSEDGLSAHFLTTLDPDVDYCVTVTVEAQPEARILAEERTSCFTTHLPCGPAVWVGRDADIGSLGSLSSNGLDFLNDLVDFTGDDLYIAMILKDVPVNASFPLSYTGYFSGFTDNEEGEKDIPPLGITSYIDGCVINADATGSCFSPDVLIPLSQDGHSNTLRVSNCSLTWSNSRWEDGVLLFDDFVLEGYATEDEVAVTLASFGEQYEFLAAYMKYDIDTDGDGEFDALSIEFDTNPDTIDLASTSCSEPTVE